MIGVVYLIGSLARAGAARHLLQLVRALDRSRFEPRVVCLSEPGELAGDFRAARVAVADLAVPSIRHPLFLPRLSRLLTALRRPRPEVLHTYLFPSNVFGALAGRAARVPVVITSRRSMSEIDTARQVLAYRLTNWAADRIVAVSEAAARSAARREGQPVGRYSVIENGIEIAPYMQGRDPGLKKRLFGLQDAEPLVGLVSNFRAVKGHEDFLEMARLLRESGSRARFLIVGDGPGRREAEERVAARGLGEAFIFAGLREDIPDVLRCLDVFVYPSHSEGISNALMEAMAAGCPIVAARCEGNEILLGRSGRLVPPGDPSTLARETARLLENRSEASELGDAAQQRARKEFTAERMARAFEGLYMDCLRARGVVPANHPAAPGARMAGGGGAGAGGAA